MSLNKSCLESLFLTLYQFSAQSGDKDLFMLGLLFILFVDKYQDSYVFETINYPRVFYSLKVSYNLIFYQYTNFQINRVKFRFSLWT